MDEATLKMTPDERVGAGHCPECGVELKDMAVAVHSLTHWPTAIMPNGANGEAIRRQKLLADYKPPAPLATHESREGLTSPTSHETASAKR